MLNSLEGRRGNPRIKPPYPAQAGVFGMPTTVNNVETPAAVRQIKAVIPGGSSVPIMTAAEAEEAIFDYEGIVAKGSMLGSAGLIVMDDSTDMVYQIWRLARFYAHESCAQCTQCREGTAWTVRVLERILSGKGQQDDFQLLLDLSENMTGKTICVLSDSCAAPIVSGIQKFRHEFEAYIQGAREPAMAAV